jgi:hypothetical protein
MTDGGGAHDSGDKRPSKAIGYAIVDDDPSDDPYD